MPELPFIYGTSTDGDSLKPAAPIAPCFFLVASSAPTHDRTGTENPAQVLGLGQYTNTPVFEPHQGTICRKRSLTAMRGSSGLRPDWLAPMIRAGRQTADLMGQRFPSRYFSGASSVSSRPEVFQLASTIGGGGQRAVVGVEAALSSLVRINIKSAVGIAVLGPDFLHVQQFLPG